MLSDQVIYGPYDAFEEPKRVQDPAIATIVMEPGDFYTLKIQNLRLLFPISTNIHGILQMVMKKRYK
ncbi:hypothetical protein F6Y02_39585 (plasmid) [Bacillus megaterium]|nr:hypothetical protein [Priestia megaterium]NGY80310.1 hypothetical protein [Priestia megaterium]